MKIDLHTHTNASDANLTRKQLLEVAKSCGVDVIAITDHDTMKNSFSSHRDPVQVVEGCELSGLDPMTNAKVHILCYLPRFSNQLNPHFDAMAKQRAQIGYEMMARAQKIYPVVNEENLQKYCAISGLVFRQSIMSVLMEFGYTKEMFGDLYRSLFNKVDGPCYVPLRYPTAVELLELVRAARGVAVLAHPSVYGSMAYGVELCKRGLLDGLEIDHYGNTDADRKTMIELCGRYNLIATGGSDYHGANSKSPIFPGDGQTDELFYHQLLERAAQK